MNAMEPVTGRQPLASIVVPTYNQARYLPACLDSIWFQDYPALEIVVVADPSPDDTFAVLRDYERAVAEDTASYASDWDDLRGEVLRTSHPRYPAQGRRLRVVYNQKRAGHGQAYNQGMRLATGEYVTYVASDDLLHPHMVARLATALASGADFAYSDMTVVDDELRVLRRFSLPDYSFEANFCHWYLLGVSKVYRRELHERFGYFDPFWLANDHECYLRFALGGARFVHVPENLYMVRSHDRRQHDVHAPATYERLYRESAELVARARAYARAKEYGPSADSKLA